MKRRLWFGLTALFLCLFFALPGAFADGSKVKITVTADPSELTEAGAATLNFTVSNYSDYELHNITIQSGETQYAIDPADLVVPVNGTAHNILIHINVADSQIGLEIPFTVSWLQNGEPQSQTVAVVIQRAADPVISLSRTASAEYGAEGESVTIEYTLKNETKFDMTDIVLVDEGINESPILANGVLYAGDTTEIPYYYTLGASDALSAPVVTYVVNGKTKTFSAIEPLTVRMAQMRLVMQVTAGTPTAEGVQFSIEVKNTGNQTISKIRVTDERDAAVNDTPFSLSAGESMTLSYFVEPAPQEPIRYVQFRLNGTDAFGAAYALQPDTKYEVYPLIEDSQIVAALTASVVTPWSSSTGKLTVRVVIQNSSTVDLTNVEITEISMGRVHAMEKLSYGETPVELTLSVGSPRNLTFTLRATDPAGTVRTLGSFLLPVAYSQSTTAPAENTPVPQATALQTGSLTLSAVTAFITKLLIVLGVVMGASFLLLIVLSVMEHRRAEYVHFPEEDDEDDDIFDIPVRNPHPSDVEILGAPSYTARVREDPRYARAERTPPAHRPAATEDDGYQSVIFVEPEYPSARQPVITDGQPARGPKVLEIKPLPAVRPKERITVKRVQTHD